MAETRTYNIFFKVAEPLYSEVIEASQEIRERYGSRFVLDGERFFPHMSIYLMRAPLVNKEQIVEAAEEFAEELKPFELKCVGLSTSASGIIMLDFERGAEASEAHKTALEKFNPLRDGFKTRGMSDDRVVRSLSHKGREYVEEYGHLFVLDKYVPHITLGVNKDRKKCEDIASKFGPRLEGKTAEIEGLWVAQEEPEPENKSVIIFRGVVE